MTEVLVNVSTPPKTLTLPVKVLLLPDRVKVPAPDFDKVPEPNTAPAYVVGVFLRPVVKVDPPKFNVLLTPPVREPINVL